MRVILNEVSVRSVRANIDGDLNVIRANIDGDLNVRL